jgi:hypothetical protein
MAATTGSENPAEEIRRLFAELQQAYARAAEAISAGGSSDNTAAGFLKETEHASEIIRRIRKAQNLGAPPDRNAEKV